MPLFSSGILSILQKQAHSLESELKSTRASLLRALHEKETLADALTLTEEELNELKSQMKENGGREEGRDDETMSQRELGELQRQMDKLSVKLFRTKGELSRSELREALLEMQRCTSLVEVEHAKFKLGGLQAALNEARHDLEGFRWNKLRVTEDTGKIAELEENIRRRDKQIEFLMSVSEASNKYEWVNEQQRGGSGGRARARAASRWRGAPSSAAGFGSGSCDAAGGDGLRTGGGSSGA